VSFIHLDVAQGTPEWHAARAGIPTASRAAAVQASGKNGKEAVTRRDYRIQLAAERITGRPQDESIYTPWMERGNELEESAANTYEIDGDMLLTCGFCRIESADAREHIYGCSPDRRIGNWDGLVSIKCPKPSTHVRYVTENRLPPEYLWQSVQEMMVVDSAEWLDFCSYCPELPYGLHFWKVRVYRSEFEADMRVYRVALKQFIDDVTDTVAQLEKLRARNA
jgi:hypothetical protein